MYKTINEAHGLAPADIKRVKDLIEKTEDKEIKRILKFLVKSNVEVDKTQDVTKMKKENKHPMKITTKNLKKIIKEELKKIMEQSHLHEDYDAEDKKAIVEAITAGLKASKIGSREPPKVTNIRRYKGSGTGFTVEIETDIGAFKMLDVEE